MQHSNIQFAIGTMSGTSMDGIDIALLKTDGLFHIQLIDSANYRYQPEERFYLKAVEFAIRQQAKQIVHNKIELIANTERNFTEYYKNFSEQTKQVYPFKSWQEIIQLTTKLHADLINSLLKKHPRVNDKTVIGYHGQTVYHQPQQKITVQLGDAKYLSQLTELPVVFEFRQHDVDLGGQGAPLAPIYHQALAIRDQLALPCAIINCGGIANVSLIKGKQMEDVQGFDIGPGNVLLDNFVRLKTNFKEHLDENGHYGKQGHVVKSCLEILKQKACRIKNYDDLPAPKSLDTADFSLPDELTNLTLIDGCATLAFFTAERIANALLAIETQWQPKLIVLVGGGRKNPVIQSYLRELLPEDIKIITGDQLQWDDSLEAQIFAYLALRHLKKMPFTLPLTTGVKVPVCGGEYIKA